MVSQIDYQRLEARKEQLRQQLISDAGARINDPAYAEALVQQLVELERQLDSQLLGGPLPPDGGLGALIGVGTEAADTIGAVTVPPVSEEYDESVQSGRIQAVADLYYLYQHERIGVFQVVLTLQKLFRSGEVRLSDGKGAFGLYQYDRRETLRYNTPDRLDAYRRVLGYGKPTSTRSRARANTDFDRLFTIFNRETSKFFRDKRVSQVIRPNVAEPGFGSVAQVRRAGLEVRANLKSASYGNVSVLRVESLQLLREAFAILEAPDVRSLFGASDVWDVIEDVQERYMGRRSSDASPRNRMAVAGRDILRWLGQDHIRTADRGPFEAALLLIATQADEWLISRQTLRRRTPAARSPR